MNLFTVDGSSARKMMDEPTRKLPEITMIECQGVTKHFDCGTSFDLFFEAVGVTAVENITLTVSSGACLHVTGPSGSGKSVLLNLIGGLYEPDDGSVRVDEQNPYRSRTVRQSISCVRPSRDEFDLRLSPRMNLNITAELYGLSREDRERRVSEVLEFLGLDEPLPGIPMGELPDGQRSLVSLASGLIP
ncbi:MAG: ATP-binding cassette domain-containing protein, partial [bacterium]